VNLGNGTSIKDVQASRGLGQVQTEVDKEEGGFDGMWTSAFIV